MVGFRARLYVNIEPVYIYKAWKGNFKKNYQKHSVINYALIDNNSFNIHLIYQSVHIIFPRTTPIFFTHFLRALSTTITFNRGWNFRAIDNISIFSNKVHLVVEAITYKRRTFLRWNYRASLYKLNQNAITEAIRLQNKKNWFNIKCH